MGNLRVGLSLGGPVIQVIHLEPLFSAQSVLPTPNSRGEPLSNLRLINTTVFT